MLRKPFLSLFACTFLFQVTSYAQFDLIKDFDGTAKSSFGYDYSGIVYSIGSKLIVQYDSVVAGNYVNIATLAAVNDAGESQYLAFSGIDNSIGVAPFFDFKTLPNGKVAFVAIESESSYKVVVTDGTKAGTITAYSAATPINGLELINNGLYFTYDGDPDHALMKIELATMAVTQVVQFGYFHMISDISKISNTSLIFMAPDAADDNNLKLYVSDGTSAGTSALATINTGSEFSQNTVMTQVGNKVYFFYKKPGSDCCNELWVTDGTVAGTKKLKEFNIIYFTDFVTRRKAIGWNNKFYFAGVETGGDSNLEEMLWVSDGTTAGTIELMEPEAQSVRPESFTIFNGALYFVVFNYSVYENRLYKTDGTAAGTHYIEMQHNNEPVTPYSLATDGNYLYMAARNFTLYGSELFRYDGVQAQCDILQGFPGGGDGDPDNLYVHQNNLYFTADPAVSVIGKELYTTGGTFTASLATGTRSAAAPLSVLYPNPATNQINVKSSEQIVALSLVGQLGTVLFKTTERSIALDSYPEGVYFVKVEFENGQSSFEKIILVK